MDFNQSLDSKNSSYYELFKKHNLEIKFEVDTTFKSWAVRSDEKYIIIAPDVDSSPTSLAHELLHILGYSAMGFIPTVILESIFKPNNTCFLTQKLDSIQNNLAHLKMLPEFFNMGYDVDDFLKNNDSLFSEFVRMTSLLAISFNIGKTNSGKPSIKDVTMLLELILIYKFFEIKNYLNPEKYVAIELYCTLLKQMDEELYLIICETLDDWLKEEKWYNYDFFHVLNQKFSLHGLPTEANWEQWQNS